jgi:hypothetical protein
MPANASDRNWSYLQESGACANLAGNAGSAACPFCASLRFLSDPFRYIAASRYGALSARTERYGRPIGRRLIGSARIALREAETSLIRTIWSTRVRRAAATAGIADDYTLVATECPWRLRSLGAGSASALFRVLRQASRCWSVRARKYTSRIPLVRFCSRWLIAVPINTLAVLFTSAPPVPVPEQRK